MVANHPFGVLDGIAIGYIPWRVRPDKIPPIRSLVGPSFAPYLIPILFEGENGALRAM